MQLWIPTGIFWCAGGCKSSGLAVRSRQSLLSLAQGLSSPQGCNSCLAGPGVEVGMLLGMLQGNRCTECTENSNDEVNLLRKQRVWSWPWDQQLSKAFPVFDDSSALTLIFFSSFSLCHRQENELWAFLELGSSVQDSSCHSSPREKREFSFQCSGPEPRDSFPFFFQLRLMQLFISCNAAVLTQDCCFRS